MAGVTSVAAEPAPPLEAGRDVPLQVAAPRVTADPRVQIAQAMPVPISPATRQAVQQARPGTLDGKQRALVERINGYLTSVQVLIGDFVQVGPDGSRSDGKFYLQKPGRVRFEYNLPNPLELVADGRSVAIRDRRLATQDLLLLSQTPLRFLLADKIDLIREGNLVTVYQDDAFLTLVLDEKQALGGTHRLMLMFSAKDTQLRQWTVTDPQGYDTTVALYNLDSSRRPDPGLFRINYERLRD
ncbi:MAG: outer-membrane lipoprotein carrier protein LolA [Variibacter sp.]|nr:outer-membrane lipoprotein carrier protein LolA [Variibacter sp.]